MEEEEAGRRGRQAAESTEPLLEKKATTGIGDGYCIEGCPGCAVDRRKAGSTGIPYGSFLFVWIVTLCTALPISSLFPFLYFMIRDLHVAKRTEDIGFYAGFVGASFMFGRCLTSTVWGMAADRIGRKPVVVFGIFAVVIFNTLFGLSVTYWMAIATRFLLGALNGLLGPIKAYAIEVCRPEHEALALSLVSTAWGIGLIIGPAIGGYLSQETLHKHKAGANEYQTVEALESHLIDPKEKANQNESDRKYGGLSLSSEDVGQVLAITGSRGHKNASMLPSFQMVVILEPCTWL
ncbi:hypothetical protein E2562_015763 [Oryza meyeriana var. granulata]|uniref:Major facilitator superfamily (MFS) profile domain-containing protein n=1 Tax=Oryza meyeriana var. granulata TaxID=110450 RepID=A0A6G1D4D2_9ORYZ|nr:hypothetical protein E2562_015763 [Oryza meyeriana var. granulata]